MYSSGSRGGREMVVWGEDTLVSESIGSARVSEGEGHAG